MVIKIVVGVVYVPEAVLEKFEPMLCVKQSHMLHSQAWVRRTYPETQYQDIRKKKFSNSSGGEDKGGFLSM